MQRRRGWTKPGWPRSCQRAFAQEESNLPDHPNVGGCSSARHSPLHFNSDRSQGKLHADPPLREVAAWQASNPQLHSRSTGVVFRATVDAIQVMTTSVLRHLLPCGRQDLNPRPRRATNGVPQAFVMSSLLVPFNRPWRRNLRNILLAVSFEALAPPGVEPETEM
jgi:hypothetical protein